MKKKLTICAVFAGAGRAWNNGISKFLGRAYLHFGRPFSNLLGSSAVATRSPQICVLFCGCDKFSAELRQKHNVT